MPENSVSDIKSFLSTPEKPVSAHEIMEFWKSLTEEQKQEYKQADLG